MGLSLLFMTLVLGLNATSNTYPNLIDSGATIKSSSDILEIDSEESHFTREEIERFAKYELPEDDDPLLNLPGPSINYGPSTYFNTNDYFTNLKTYSPINNIGSCGYVSLIQPMSFYDTFYNDSVIPDLCEYKNTTATNYSTANFNSPGVIGEHWASFGYDTYYEYVHATENYNLQSKLTALRNLLGGTDNVNNFIYSIGGWNYQTMLNAFYGNQSTVDVIETDNVSQQYVSTGTAKQITKDNITFNTNRLRCGSINDTGVSETGSWYIVLSANKSGAGTAYLSYDFDFNAIDIDLSFWAYGEGLYSSTGTAKIEYKNSLGFWVSTPALDLLNDVTLPNDRTNPNTYRVYFPNGTRSFRIISIINNPSGSINKARICIGDLKLFNYN
jgi:hypothetical protein